MTDDANLYEGTYCSLFRPLSVMIYTGTLPKYTGEHGDFPDGIRLFRITYL